MQQLVLTILGKDRTGLVDTLSATVLAHHGNWLASNLSHLAGQFAGILQIEVEETHQQGLIDALNAITDLEIKIQTAAQPAQQENQSINLVITGNDRAGIVQELAAVIRHKGGNITHLNSQQQSAPNWGVPIFSAVVTVALPQGMQRDTVVEALEAMTSDLIVDIEE